MLIPNITVLILLSIFASEDIITVICNKIFYLNKVSNISVKSAYG